MGMFDTLKFRKPLFCEKCNAEIVDTKTKNFDNTLSMYTEGDFFHGGTVITGVIEEILFCNSCKHYKQRVFIAIWHSLYAGTYGNYEDAEKRIFSIEKTDLLEYIMFQQKRYIESAHRYNRFYGLIRLYAEFIADKEAFLNDNGLLSIHKNKFKEYIESDDEIETLKKILKDFTNDFDLPDDVIF